MTAKQRLQALVRAAIEEMTERSITVSDTRLQEGPEWNEAAVTYHLESGIGPVTLTFGLSAVTISGAKNETLQISLSDGFQGAKSLGGAVIVSEADGLDSFPNARALAIRILDYVEMR